MTVEGHRVAAQSMAEATHGQPLDPVTVDDLQRGRQHQRPGNPPVVVFDALGGDFVQVVLDTIAPRGRLVSFGASAGQEIQINIQVLYRKMISLLGYGGIMLTPEERRPGLEAALEALRSGALRVRIDEVLPLEDVNDAFERLVGRRVQGKLLLGLR